MSQGVEGQVRIDAPADRVRAVIDDIGAWATWATGVRESAVLETDDGGRVTRARFVVDTPIAPVAYTLAYVHDDTEVRWELVEGELVNRLTGSYTVTASDGATLVDGSLDVGVSIPVPATYVRRLAGEILERGLGDLRAHCERDG